jgi:hypothetical protein
VFRYANEILAAVFWGVQEFFIFIEYVINIGMLAICVTIAIAIVDIIMRIHCSILFRYIITDPELENLQVNFSTVIL